MADKAGLVASLVSLMSGDANDGETAANAIADAIEAFVLSCKLTGDVTIASFNPSVKAFADDSEVSTITGTISDGGLI